MSEARGCGVCVAVCSCACQGWQDGRCGCALLALELLYTLTFYEMVDHWPWLLRGRRGEAEATGWTKTPTFTSLPCGPPPAQCNLRNPHTIPKQRILSSKPETSVLC